jgi:hypothetical protein
MLLSMNEVTLVHIVNEETPPGLIGVLANVNFADYCEIQIHVDPARTCQQIAQALTSKRLIVIATGSACRQLPAIAMAQRASGKAILGYQLIAPSLPLFTDSWPQAPITAHFPAGSAIPKEVKLRGIAVEEFTDLTALASFIEGLLP